MIIMHNKLKQWYRRYKRHLSSLMLIVGFAIDNLTLTRIDLWFDNIILLFYLFVAGLGIFIVNLHEGEVFSGAVSNRIRSVSPLLIQFAFGGLFSGFVVFYMRSASFAGSALFVIFLAIMLVGNEFFKERYLRLTFQLSIFFIALFSFLIFYVPVLVHAMGASIFLLSGIASLLIIGGIIFLLQYFIPLRIKKSKKTLVSSIGIIFILMNIFYFANIIPPLPLSLKNAGVYYNIEKTLDGNYAVKYEEARLRDFFRQYKILHITPGETAYLYSAVFAPTDLNIPIIHSWKYYDEKNNKWVTTDNLQFPIIGGRDGGYRGYSAKKNLIPGRWRVDIITKRGQLLGRVKFEVKKVDNAPVLKTSIL